MADEAELAVAYDGNAPVRRCWNGASWYQLRWNGFGWIEEGILDEVDALLKAVAGTALSPEGAALVEAARAKLLRPPLRVIDGGEGWDPEALFEHQMYGGG